MNRLAELRLHLHETALRMVRDGLVVGSAGNLSVRLDEEHVVVTAGGVPYERLTPEDHPVVSLVDGTWTGPRPPTSEVPLHTELHRGLPGVEAVVHTHSKYAAAFSVARLELPFICNENLGPASERILVAEYGVAGTHGLGEAALAALHRQPGSRACLLANHGVVAVAPDLDVAYLVAAQVEWIAEISHLARALGAEHVLAPEVQDRLAATYRTTIARPRPDGPAAQR